MRKRSPSSAARGTRASATSTPRRIMATDCPSRGWAPRWRRAARIVPAVDQGGAPAASRCATRRPRSMAMSTCRRSCSVRLLAAPASCARSKTAAQRLGLDRIDLVYVHDLDRATHGADFEHHFRALLDSGLPALAEIKRAGAHRRLRHRRERRRHLSRRVAARGSRRDSPGRPLYAWPTNPRCPTSCLRASGAALPGRCWAGRSIPASWPRGLGRADRRRRHSSTTRRRRAEVVAHVAAIEVVCARHGVPLRAAAACNSPPPTPRSPSSSRARATSG